MHMHSHTRGACNADFQTDLVTCNCDVALEFDCDNIPVQLNDEYFKLLAVYFDWKLILKEHVSEMFLKFYIIPL